MNRDLQTNSNDRFAPMRREYEKSGLTEAETSADPIEQFNQWFTEAATAGVREPNAMTLATVDEHGAPDARIVLLKGLDGGGFVFYTNYESAKGRQLAGEPRAALCFFWHDLERQVRIRGLVSKIPAAESADYFRSRPRDSQIGAWASTQSGVVDSREHIEERFAAMLSKYPGVVPPPPHWGGYRLLPGEIEFWQGRRNRLHDRILYRRDGGNWIRERLSP